MICIIVERFKSSTRTGVWLYLGGWRSVAWQQLKATVMFYQLANSPDLDPLTHE